MKTTECLVTHGADASLTGESGQTALHLAATNADIDILDILLTQPVNDFAVKNQKGWTLMRSTINEWAPELIHMLECFIEHGAALQLSDVVAAKEMNMDARSGAITTLYHNNN